MTGDVPSEPTPALAADAPLLAILRRSQELGFLGPGPVAAHVEHAQGFLSLIGSPDTVLDLGSGGGVPGLVLARALQATTFVLLDAMERRCRFLEHAVEELGLAHRVSVRCGRAEEFARQDELRGRFPVVVTRSFGPPAVTAECAVGFLRPPSGRVVVSEPPDPDPLRWPADGLALLGLRALATPLQAGAAMQVLEMTAPVEERFPRRVGIPVKRPLF